MNDRLEEIKDRCEVATPGKWGYSQIFNSILGGRGWTKTICHSAADNGNNMDFIANARQDVPWLIEQLESKRAEVERLRVALIDAINNAGTEGDYIILLTRYNDLIGGSDCEKQRTD